jgi:malonyl CoA-acyl carrier protein transacylase
VGVCKDIHDREPAFRSALAECDKLLEGPLGVKISELLYPTSPEPDPAADGLTVASDEVSAEKKAAAMLRDPRFAQPVLVAVEYCLSEVWKSRGVLPGGVLGHSLGEYAAAIVAGVLSLKDGLHMVCERGRLMSVYASSCRGVMEAVRASEDDVL